mmetsp:Transcript_8089/g.15411  ORF Transcript_8089/g.15411 Transcript_8089/m.15411 type:complete len:544 (-) Transcript_8089:86-1717(-)|eukprot:scaffold4223_cov189-Amphora_coffeaeformis.AAC.62
MILYNQPTWSVGLLLVLLSGSVQGFSLTPPPPPPPPTTSTTTRITHLNGIAAWPQQRQRYHYSKLYVSPTDAAVPRQNNTASSSVAKDDLVRQFVEQQHQHQEGDSSRSDGQTAILLNTNARSVSKQVVEAAIQVFGEQHVFVTQTAEEAATAASHILERRYALVIPVGGDGTLSSLVNLLCEEIVSRQSITDNSGNTRMTLDEAMKYLPTMAYIPLGTGNGVGSVVGNPVKRPPRKWGGSKRRRQLTRTLQRLQAIGTKLGRQSANDYEDEDYELINMPMMEVTHPTTSNASDDDGTTKNGDLCFFAGVGFDSLMLNDFKRIKAWSIRTGFLTRMLSSVTGYVVALVVRTLPQSVFEGRHNIHVELSTRNINTTLWVDHRRGDVVRPVQNAVLYKGMTGILAAGTSPFYGGGLRLFPFARLTTDQMHLRVGRIHPLTGFLNIPQIFAGTYRDKSERLRCLDFIGSDFDVQVQAAPLSDDDDESSATSNSQDKDTKLHSNPNDKGYPFQHSGESVGHVERFRLRVVKEPVRFVCLNKARPNQK